MTLALIWRWIAALMGTTMGYGVVVLIVLMVMYRSLDKQQLKKIVRWSGPSPESALILTIFFCIDIAIGLLTNSFVHALVIGVLFPILSGLVLAAFSDSKKVRWLIKKLLS